MNKRLLSAAALAVSCIILASCSGGKTASTASGTEKSSEVSGTAFSDVPADTNAEPGANASGFNMKGEEYAAECSADSKAPEGIKVEGVGYIEDEKDNYFVLLITNEGDKDRSLDVNITFYDADGNEMNSQTEFVPALGGGATGFASFMPDSGYASYKYNVTDGAAAGLVSADSSLEAKVEKREDSALVSVTNKGELAAEDVYYCIFYYENGALKFYSEGRCMDTGNEIKPGATETDENAYYGVGSYDDVKIYVHGCCKTSG